MHCCGQSKTVKRAIRKAGVDLEKKIQLAARQAASLRQQERQELAEFSTLHK